MLLFLVTPFLVVAVQPYMEWIPILKKVLNFSITSKTLSNKDIANMEDVKDLEKEEAGTIHAKISLVL